jgi:bifunctional non-homologous end joining protein LigD
VTADEDAQALPEWIAPMLATAGTVPVPDEGWAYEMKWDGVRAIARIAGGTARFTSRNRNDLTLAFPELAPIGEALGSVPALLDGEVVAFDDGGKPSFQLLQNRRTTDEARAARGAAEHPAVYVVFDLLYLGGHSLLDASYEDRRRLLEDLELHAGWCRTSPRFAGPGKDVLAASKQQGLEGVVAKQLASRYTPGRRSPAWIKVKLFKTQEVVIGGWTPGQGRRSGRFGALMMGIPERDVGNRDGGLRYVGKVGTGFDEARLEDLSARLAALRIEASPFSAPVPSPEARRATWVRPELVGEVAYGEWTNDGRLRHPSWRGLREDKAPSDVVVEP